LHRKIRLNQIRPPEALEATGALLLSLDLVAWAVRAEWVALVAISRLNLGPAEWVALVERAELLALEVLFRRNHRLSLRLEVFAGYFS
jgi:hypothetical protein